MLPLAQEGAHKLDKESCLRLDRRCGPLAASIHKRLPAVVERQQKIVAVDVLDLLLQRREQGALSRLAGVEDKLAIELIHPIPDRDVLADAFSQRGDRQPNLTDQIDELGADVDGGVGLLVAVEPMALAPLADDLAADAGGERARGDCHAPGR